MRCDSRTDPSLQRFERVDWNEVEAVLESADHRQCAYQGKRRGPSRELCSPRRTFLYVLSCSFRVAGSCAAEKANEQQCTKIKYLSNRKNATGTLRSGACNW